MQMLYSVGSTEWSSLLKRQKQMLPPHLKSVATLFCKIWTSTVQCVPLQKKLEITDSNWLGRAYQIQATAIFIQDIFRYSIM